MVSAPLTVEQRLSGISESFDEEVLLMKHFADLNNLKNFVSIVKNILKHSTCSVKFRPIQT